MPFFKPIFVKLRERIFQFKREHGRALAAPLLLILLCLILLGRDFYLEGQVEGSGAPIGKVSESQGDVKRKPSDRLVWFDLRKSQSVYSAESIRTTEGGLTQLTLQDGTELEVGPSSMVVLKQLTGKLSLDFMTGAVRVRRAGSQGLRIRSGDSVIEAQAGSKLDVKTEPAGEVQVQVQQGAAVVSQELRPSVDVSQGKTFSLPTESRPPVVTQPEPLPTVAATPPRLPAPEVPAISPISPSEDTGLEKTLKWGRVEGADAYQVKVWAGGELVMTKAVPLPQVKLTMPEPGEYRFKIAGIRDGVIGRSSSEQTFFVEEPKPDPEPEVIEPENEPQVATAPEPSLDPVPVPVVIREALAGPRIVTPLVGKQELTPGSELAIEWEPSKGARGYEVRLEPLGDAGRTPSSEVVKKTELTQWKLRAPAAGKYRLSVRALASLHLEGHSVAHSRDAAGTATSELDFELTEPIPSETKAGYVALSTMLAPYAYNVRSPNLGFSGTANSTAVTGRLSGEIWLKPRWGISAGFEDTVFTVFNTNYNRWSFDLAAKYRHEFGWGGGGWFFYPKAGVEFRQNVQILPNASGTPGVVGAVHSFNTPGFTVGFDFRKQFTERLSLGLKFNYFVPVMILGFPTPVGLTADASFRNLSLGAQGIWWATPRLGLGLGGLFELRSISFAGAGASGAEQVSMDGAYFFASLIYRFGVPPPQTRR